MGNRHDQQIVPPRRERRNRTAGTRRRRHDLSGDGLHRHCQSADTGRSRHGPRGGVRRHLPVHRSRLRRDGAVRELSHRPGAGHGNQRLLRLRRRAGNGTPMANRARRAVHFRRLLRAHLGAADPSLDHQRLPALAQVGDRRGNRLPARDHRDAKRRHRRRRRSHPGRARRCEFLERPFSPSPA